MSGLIGRIAGRAQRDWADLATLGPSWFGYQASRLAGRRECRVRVAGGAMVIRPADSDVATIRQVFHGKEYQVPQLEVDRAIGARYDSLLASGCTPMIVDAGANIGAASRWFRQSYPDAHIAAIEPDPANFALLKRNLAADANVTLFAAAIGATPGKVALLVEGDSWATQTERSDSGTPVVTMAAAFSAVPNSAPFIAKIDIEGFESDLFADNLGWLDDVIAVYIEPHDWRFPGRHTSRSFQRAMAPLDFHLFMVGENLLYVRL